jgi:hypothetical protein
LGLSQKGQPFFFSFCLMSDWLYDV